MAKISELVKTYKLLSDPNAPDWNVRFVGGIVVAIVIAAASGALLWSAVRSDAPAAAPAAASMETQDAPGDVTTCDPTEVAEELARQGGRPLPSGHKLASGCVVG